MKASIIHEALMELAAEATPPRSESEVIEQLETWAPKVLSRAEELKLRGRQWPEAEEAALSEMIEEMRSAWNVP